MRRAAREGPVAVLGAGGHAKVVLSILLAAGYFVAGVFDDDPALHGRMLLGYPVRDSLGSVAASGAEAAVIAIGQNAARAAVAQRINGLPWLTVVHPGAYVHPSVHLGPGTVVCAGAVIQPDAHLGAHVIVNTGATVDHDCVLGDFAHVAPGSHLAGDVRVGEGVLLGVGTAVIPGRQIGNWTTVGAGAVVTRDLPGGITAVGVPARTSGR